MASSSTPCTNIPAYLKLHIQDLEETKATIKSKKQKMENLLREFNKAEAANNQHRAPFIVDDDDDDTSYDGESFENIENSIPEPFNDDSDDDNKVLTADDLASDLAYGLKTTIEHLTEFIKFYDRQLVATEKYLKQVEMFM